MPDIRLPSWKYSAVCGWITCCILLFYWVKNRQAFDKLADFEFYELNICPAHYDNIFSQLKYFVFFNFIIVRAIATEIKTVAGYATSKLVCVNFMPKISDIIFSQIGRKKLQAIPWRKYTYVLNSRKIFVLNGNLICELRTK